MNALGELLVTVVTLVWFLSGVGEDVSLQITAVSEGFLTVVTGVWFFVSVCKDVSL